MNLLLRPLFPGAPGERAREVTRIDSPVLEMVDEMLEVMRRAGYPSLSAPLLGVPHRVIAIDLTGSGRSQVVLVNPVLEAASSERQVDREGCAGLPDVTASVERPLHITVAALARSGQPIRLHAGGLLARLIHHELDHLEGRSFLDRLRGVERARIEASMRLRHPRCLRFPSPTLAPPGARR